MVLVVVTIVLGVTAAGLRTAPGRPRPLRCSAASVVRAVGHRRRP
ncbi:hypothetical protein [Nocardioides flavescens]|nr:hypothetical protein [Nocardioides flavescens]